MGGDSDDFARAVARISVAQILSSAGFDATYRSAVDTLADVLLRYISNLCRVAASNANLAGRTDANAFDVIAALEELGSTQGFLGNGLARPCLCASGVVRDLTSYVNSEEEVPFARALPSFPVQRTREPVVSIAESGITMEMPHVPDWLPVLREPADSRQTEDEREDYSGRREDRVRARVEEEQQQRKAKESLMALHRLFRIGGSDWVDSSDAPEVQSTDDAKGNEATAASNPYFSVPLSYGEVDISEIDSPKDAEGSRKVSVLDAFAPLISAAENGNLEAAGKTTNHLPKERRPVHLSLRIDRESVAAALHSKTFDRRDMWPIKVTEKDDRKRRAEMILKEAMENPQELPQV